MIDEAKNEMGSPVDPDRIPCPMCGATIAVGSRKCAWCGEALTVGRPLVLPVWVRRGAATLTIVGLGTVLLAWLLPSVNRGREGPRRSQCKINLKQIALALRNYEAEYHSLPPAYTVDAEGKPLHSWRTLILPYLDQRSLYQSIDLSKPWDDPANAKASNTPLPIYYCPTNYSAQNHTTYLASVGSNSCFRLTEPRRLSEITDGQSQTLMVIEVPAEQSIPWMSPQDADESLVMSIGPESKLAHRGGTQAAFCDGSVRFLPADMPPAARRALITVSGHDEVGEF